MERLLKEWQQKNISAGISVCTKKTSLAGVYLKIGFSVSPRAAKASCSNQLHASALQSSQCPNLNSTAGVTLHSSAEPAREKK